MNCAKKRCGYILAIAASTVVLLVRLTLSEPLADRAALSPFVLAVIVAAWRGGLGPGLVATLVSLIYIFLFVFEPAHPFSIETAAGALSATIFVALGTTISLLFEALYRARRRESEQQFRTLADSMPQLVWMARADGRPFWFNQRCYEYTGATPGQVDQSVVRSFHDPAELRRILENWKSALASGKAWEDIYPLRRKDGQMRWHLCRAVPVRDACGNIMYWFGTNTDIQDRIQFEHTLQEADARKDQFLAVLAHELRNPLSPISNALELWPHVAGDPAEMEHLRAVIDRQVRQLVRLIDDLLDVSRITRGKITLQRQPVSIQSLIHDAVDAVHSLVQAAGHQLTVTAPDEPIYVHGDAARLTQVFSNILNNAAKYTVRKGQISVIAQRSGDRALVTIRDNGPGIPKSMLEAIFEPFRQDSNTLDRSCGGLGIGLWLARQLVELQQGTIEAHSEGPGKGSEFVVTLPAIATPRPAADADGKAHRSQQANGMPSHRVLIVDDLRESAETLAMVMQSLGQDATALFDGQAAIDWILDHHPDVVFLDIAMPKLDGYEVARRLRRHPELQDVVLVALTGYGQRTDRNRALKAGFNHHLTKPANIPVLKDLLLRMPARREVREATTV